MRKALALFLLLVCVYLPSLPAATTAVSAAQAPQTAPIPKPKDFDNGLKVAMEATKEYGVVDDQEQNRRLNEIGYKVAMRAAPNAANYSFRIVKMEEPNAFSLPGGFIFVTTGMLDLNLTDDQLAALLGHEITHIKNEHSRKMAKRQTIMNLLYQAMVLGVAFGMKDNNQRIDPTTGYPLPTHKDEILQGSAAFGVIFQELLLRGFNRELELEADREGMRYAAGAGYSPDGTNQLFELMHRHIFEAPGYGYWMTHPYLEDRMEIARTLSPSVEASKNPPDDADYRKKTQQTFVSLISNQKGEPEKLALRTMAIAAWDRGKTAEDLRQWFIDRDESREMAKEPFFRDYGLLTREYQAAVKEFTEDADFTKKLQDRLVKLQNDTAAVSPMYEEVLSKGNFDTDMLKRYISSFPDSPRLPEVRYRLAENYRILQKTPEAVDLYLTVLNSDSPWKAKSKDSLLQAIPHLKELSACYKIAQQVKDPEVKKMADERMKTITASFDSLQNGYDFRRAYPTSEFEKPVREQLSKLAAETLHQAKLYQAVGEYQKALDGYNKILRYCGDLPVADQVKDDIVNFQELKAVKG